MACRPGPPGGGTRHAGRAGRGITTDRGTLTTRDTGIFDTAGQGLFSSRDLVVSGTGEFAGATGFLFFHGTGTTTFTSAADGEICLAE